MVRGKIQAVTTKGSSGKKAATAKSIAAPSPTMSKQKSSKEKQLTIMSCCKCGIVINDDAKALQCDRCLGQDTWKCIDCLDISSDTYDYLVAEPTITLRWFCDSCEQVVMNPRGNTPSLQGDKLDSLISLVEKLMQRCESFENKLTDKCDKDDALKLENRIGKLEEKFAKWEDATETRFESLENRVPAATVDRATEQTQGPTDEELIKLMVQEEMNRKTESERDTEIRKKNIIIYRIPEKKL